MKKVILVLAVILTFAADHAFAQSRAVTPRKNSSVRKAIITVVKKKFGKTRKNIDNPDIFKIQGNWARIVYDVKSKGDEGSTGINLLLKKTGGVWKIIFDYSRADDADPDDYFKDIPRGVYDPWNN